MGGNKKNKELIPYKIGQVLYSDKNKVGYSSKIKILKHNGNNHYKIAIYYNNAHHILCSTMSNVSIHTFNREGLKTGLSETLKRL